MLIAGEWKINNAGISVVNWSALILSFNISDFRRADLEHSGLAFCLSYNDSHACWHMENWSALSML